MSRREAIGGGSLTLVVLLGSDLAIRACGFAVMALTTSAPMLALAAVLQ